MGVSKQGDSKFDIVCTEIYNAIRKNIEELRHAIDNDIYGDYNLNCISPEPLRFKDCDANIDIKNAIIKNNAGIIDESKNNSLVITDIGKLLEYLRTFYATSNPTLSNKRKQKIQELENYASEMTRLYNDYNVDRDYVIIDACDIAVKIVVGFLVESINNSGNIKLYADEEGKIQGIEELDDFNIMQREQLFDENAIREYVNKATTKDKSRLSYKDLSETEKKEKLEKRFNSLNGWIIYFVGQICSDRGIEFRRWGENGILLVLSDRETSSYSVANVIRELVESQDLTYSGAVRKREKT